MLTWLSGVIKIIVWIGIVYLLILLPTTVLAVGIVLIVLIAFPYVVGVMTSSKEPERESDE